MAEQHDEAVVYNINKEYRIVRLRGNKCSLFFKNKQNQLLATLEGCREIFTQIVLNDNQSLSELERGYLLSFIRAKKCSISKEVADILKISTIKYADGREEYLSEKMLKRRIAQGIDFAKVYVTKLSARSIRIQSGARDCSYNFSEAKVTKVIVDSDCSINLDFRDNQYIESLIIGERFFGSINLSRTTIGSIFIANNCRCNLNIADSKRCFNLQIADIYSGNLNISNSCLYAFGVGYYSYADIMLANNIIKKDIIVGDSFRGGLYATNQNVGEIKIGDDCKGIVKIHNHTDNLGVKTLVVGDDFSGSLNISGDDSVTRVDFGRKMSGKLDASYASLLKRLKIGKYYSGNINLSGSSVENAEIEYGASGSMRVDNCSHLALVQATVDNNLIFEGNLKNIKAKKYQGNVYYSFDNNRLPQIKEPIYKKIYHNLYDRFM